MINYRIKYIDKENKVLEVTSGELADLGQILISTEGAAFIEIEWRADGNNRIHELSPD